MLLALMYMYLADILLINLWVRRKVGYVHLKICTFTLRYVLPIEMSKNLIQESQ